jgi:DNA-binding transcriptional regulator LsrR (DeoR family)
LALAARTILALSEADTALGRLAGAARRRAVEAVEILFELPIVTPRVIADRLGISVPGAKNLLELLKQEGIVRTTVVSSSRAKRWVAEEVLGVIAD